MNAAAFTPTAEQQEILRLFQTGDSLVVQAGAGTGKTSTLLLLAAAAGRRRGQYIAFNKSIVEETKAKLASRNLRSCYAHTAHGLAFRELGKNYSHRLRTPRMKSMELASRLGTGEIRVEFEGERKVLSRSFLAGLVMRSVDRFCMTADDVIGARHVPFVRNIDEEGSFENNNLVAAQLVPLLEKAWADAIRVNGVLPYAPDRYLKQWQLSRPVIGADYIMFDEAQDANPVMVDIVSRQGERGCQLVWVGDSQQQIYEFTGAINALATVPAKNEAFLTRSFRFGPAVAAEANKVLAQIPDARLRIVGHDPIDSIVGPLDDENAVLCRTNAEAVRTVLQSIRAGRRPFLVGGATEVVQFALAARALMDGASTDHPELACFDSWDEVQRYVTDDPQGDDLRLLVELIDEFGVDVILEALDGLPSSKDKAAELAADLIVSTAHKSKGREWDRVRLAGDFGTDPDDGEMRLLYVALTRAKTHLDITQVEWLMTLPAASSAAPSAPAGTPTTTPEPGAAETSRAPEAPQSPRAPESPSAAPQAQDGPPVAPPVPVASPALPVPQTGIVGICGKCGRVVAPDADPYDSGRCINGSFAATHPVAAITWHRLSPVATPDRFLAAS